MYKGKGGRGRGEGERGKGFACIRTLAVPEASFAGDEPRVSFGRGRVGGGKGRREKGGMGEWEKGEGA